MVSRACLQIVMRGTQRGTNLLSLSRMTWEPMKRPARDPALHTLSHTSKTGNLRRAAHSLTELPPETHTLPGSIEISQFFPLWYQTQRAVNVMRGTQRGSNLMSCLSRMTWEPVKRPTRDPTLYTLSHTRKTREPIWWPMGAGNLHALLHEADRLPMAYGAKAARM